MRSEYRHALGLIVVLGSMGLLDAAPSPLPRRDRGEATGLQGRWRLTEAFRGGEPDRSSVGLSIQLEVRGHNLTLFIGKEVFESHHLSIRTHGNHREYRFPSLDSAQVRRIELIQQDTLCLEWSSELRLIFTRVR